MIVVSVRRLVLMIAGVLMVSVMVVADVKMEVEETGAHFAVAVPVFGRVQTKAGRAHCTREQQAGACGRQPADQDFAKSSHFSVPG